MTKLSRLEPEPQPPQLLTLDETCQVLRCSLKTLRRRIDDGALAVIRDGRLIRIHPDDLQRYIQQRRYG